jgi:outer membrane receptor protein involved in Fe transport
MATSNPRLARAMKRAIYSSVTVPMVFAATDVLAQSDDVEEIVVTGSRIARDPNVGANVPVQSLSSQDIQLAGDVDLGEVLNDMPSLLGSNTASNSISGIFGTGSGETAGTAEVGETILQLRGLGVERTLVLVNGRRHVAGVGGSQAVDIGSIPQQLVERVDVLTGGASAIYGADAVTGVVNFILKDDYEGLNFNVAGGMSGEGDAENYSVSALYGVNFADDRGNLTFSADYTKRQKLLNGDRSWSRNNGVASDDQNPALRFQVGDIDPSSTPNFAQFYSPGTAFASTDSPCDLFDYNYCYGFHPVGFPILDADAFNNLWAQAFPDDPLPTFSQAELALMERAANAPTRAILPQHNFSLTSAGGVLLPGGLFDPELDIDENGVNDCTQSYQGYYSTYQFSPPALGFIGGCWIIDPDGSVRPLQDGLIAGDINQFGLDGVPDQVDTDELLPSDDKFVFNLNARYDLSNRTSAFFEGKYARQQTTRYAPYSSFWDLLTISPDNPYIDQLPAELAAIGRDQGLYNTRDPRDLGPNRNQGTRETQRFVLGLEGELENGWGWEIAANFGKFDLEFQEQNRVIVDRWFAAIDAVEDENGNIICRSDIDDTPPPTTPFDIPAFSPSFWTFNPGDGSCKPANILGGVGGISQEAIDFVTAPITNNFETEQFVFSAVLTGDSTDWFSAPGGPVGFAIGAEYRDEKSKSTFDPLVRGVLPVTTAWGNAGELLADVAPTWAEDTDGDGVIDVPFDQRSLVFDSESVINNVVGSYDVLDIFGEISVPLLSGAAFAEDLTLDAAIRLSDYSTVGQTTTWKVGGSWTPVNESLRFRASYAIAVRAPNVDELFSPSQGAFFRPVDPCDFREIEALIEAGDARGPIRQANCAAAGISTSYTDPLTARFVGEVRGNPELNEEEGETVTVGAIFSPGFLPGFTLTLDYWDIVIKDAIDAPSGQSIVNSCYDSADFPNNQFCDLIRRNDDDSSPQFNGLEFISQQQLNIGKLEATGVDFAARYQFDLSSVDLALGLSGTWMDKLNRFFDPTNPSAVDPELGELQRPEWAGNFTVELGMGDVLFAYQMQYLDKQALRDVEIETIDSLYGPAGMADATYLHDLSVSWNVNEQYQVYGGVNNIADEKPFLTEYAFPVSPVGRFFFVGLNMNVL